MSSNGLEVEHWDEAASASFRARCLILSASVLLIHDMVLTIDCEIKTMWQPKFRVADFVYFTNRRVQSLLGIFEVLIACATRGGIPAFSGLRTYALSRGNHLFGWMVFAMSAMFTIPNIYSIGSLRGLSLPPPFNCVSRNSVASTTRWVESDHCFQGDFLAFRNYCHDLDLEEHRIICFAVSFILDGTMFGAELGAVRICLNKTR
ncbi:hypothetical protein V8D89_009011 [Ganoderma adspersum]